MLALLGACASSGTSGSPGGGWDGGDDATGTSRDGGDAATGGGDASGTAGSAHDAGGDAPHASTDGGADGGVTPLLAFHATSGWQVYPGGSYHYGPSILIDTDSSVHMWTCSPGTGGAWDFIRYHHSTDHGMTWSADVIALQPTAGSVDAYSTCDPGAVKIGTYFYIGYTSTTNSAGTQNDVFVARSTSPTGPFDKWNGTGWGGNPAPVIHYTGVTTDYGYGEPSLVLMGKKLFLYYSDDEATQSTNVQTVDDATVDDWPLHLVDHGAAIHRDRNAQDSADVKYVDALGVFVAVTSVDRFTPNGSIATYRSTDGLTFTPAAYLGARTQIGTHNVGLSGGLDGHLDVTASNFVGYAYQPAGNGWGNWPTYVDPITLGTAPWGTPVAGEVSSIVGGNDWNWSGPRAWDADPTTIFSSDSHGTTTAANEWIWVDVGYAASITGVTLVPRGLGYGFPTGFTIQSSPDAATWTDVPGQQYTAYPPPGSTPVTLTFAKAVSARYLRLSTTTLGVDDHGTAYLQLAEITPSVAP